MIKAWICIFDFEQHNLYFEQHNLDFEEHMNIISHPVSLPAYIGKAGLPGVWTQVSNLQTSIKCCHNKSTYVNI